MGENSSGYLAGTEYKENMASAEPLAKVEADVALILLLRKLYTVRVKKAGQGDFDHPNRLISYRYSIMHSRSVPSSKLTINRPPS